MIHLYHKTRNMKNEPLTFHTLIHWIGNKKGVLQADDVAGDIYVSPPKEFGGEGKDWTPEHLFLGAINSCFMSTLLTFARKYGVGITNFESVVTGQIEKVDGHYLFTQVDLYPKLHIIDEEQRGKAEQLLLTTSQHCLITASLSCRVVYHTEIFNGHKPVALTEKIL